MRTGKRDFTYKSPFFILQSLICLAVPAKIPCRYGGLPTLTTFVTNYKKTGCNLAVLGTIFANTSIKKGGFYEI